ncbi:MAG: serine hydrolase domain-containing protein, partial [Acidobacteriaceae bacterium]
MTKLTVSALMVLFLCLSLSPSLSAQISTQVTPSQIDAIFRPLVASDSPGLAVGVLQHSKLVFARGYGLANLAQHTPITPTTDFRLASLTKQFTATAIMLLVHDGKLHYDDTLTKIFSEFPAYGGKITIRELLNHTSGLKDYEPLYDPHLSADHPETTLSQRNAPLRQVTDKEVLHLLEQQTTTNFPPGSKWEYSNSGYSVLAMVVERVSGMPFEDFLAKRIFQPLHMDHTLAFVQGKNTVPNRAFGYGKDKNGEWMLSDQSPTSAVLGDGGIYTSINDMAKWDRALIHHTLLSALEMQPSITPVEVPGGVQKPDGSASAYGFGWFLDPY